MLFVCTEVNGSMFFLTPIPFYQATKVDILHIFTEVRPFK
jgi:hypothetical protein